MDRIYFDNAASTPLDPEVFEVMKPYIMENFGNPSSIHEHGRRSRAAIESARKQVAGLLNCTPGEIIFTSGGTEADNAIITGALEVFNLKHIISSPIEHHAVLHTVKHLGDTGRAQVHWVKLTDNGDVDYADLERLLEKFPETLVALMHANNEVANVTDLERVGDLCDRYKAYFHTDAVQSTGHFRHDLSALKVCGLAASAHKFHGPKGTGFMYIRKDKKLHPFIHGGAQERGMRGGTENVSGIVGLAKALEVAYRDMDVHRKHIEGLKSAMIAGLKEKIDGVSFNGNSGDVANSLYTVLNVSLPESDANDMLLFNLDLEGVSVSGGSACSSGALQGSHVLNMLYPGSKRGAIRLSFSKFNTLDEVERVVTLLHSKFRVEV